MTDHRYEAHATIVPGACELAVDGHLIGLVTLMLTATGPVTMPDGTDDERPDVICPLRVCQVRSLAGRLIKLAEQAQATR